MAKRFLTAEQVKGYLNISDFRHLTKEKLIEFVSAIPYMDKEVAIKIIEQFPEYSRLADTLVTQLKSSSDTIAESNSESIQLSMEGYKDVLSALKDLMESQNLDASDRRYYAEKMVEIADKMATLDAKNKEFLIDLNKSTTWFAALTLLACSTILGARIVGLRVPQLS